MNLNIKVNNQVFQVKIGNLKERPILVELDGNIFEVWPEEDSAVQGKPNSSIQIGENPVVSSKSVKLNSSDINNQRSRSILAPIPGMITAVYVTQGTEVSVGQELLKLEAMKMNNSIRSNRSGIISAVHVSVGQMVKLNQTLLEYS